MNRQSLKLCGESNLIIDLAAVKSEENPYNQATTKRPNSSQNHKICNQNQLTLLVSLRSLWRKNRPNAQGGKSKNQKSLFQKP